MTILTIILFIISLSCLIIIHELGHLLAAKAFKVYCNEFSIGFGPKLISKRKKGKETAFSLRALPLGGFVSMYSEEGALPQGVEVDSSRSLNNIKKWKRGLVLSAGVIMNAVLSMVLFFCSEAFFVQKNALISYVEVAENSQAAELGMTTSNIEENQYKAILYAAQLTDSMYVIDGGATLEYMDSAKENTALVAVLNVEDFSFKDMSYDNMLEFYPIAINEDQSISVNLNNKIKASGEIKQINFSITERQNIWQDTETLLEIRDGYFWINGVNTNVATTETDASNVVMVVNENHTWSIFISDTTDEVAITTIPATGEVGERYNAGYRGTRKSYDFAIKTHVNSSAQVEFDSTGLSMYLYQYKNTYKEAVKNTFEDFGSSSILIFKTIGQLLTSKEARKNVGGIIAIGVQSSKTLQNYGFSYYLRLWAIVSVNLAIMNLLPIPGLDGWHLLVLSVEAIFKKKMSTKAKTIATYIGFGLLIALTVVILIKDVITYL